MYLIDFILQYYITTFFFYAINIFAQRRPPGVYKRDYIEALYSFYHEVPENMMIACPPTPEWKRPDDLDLNGEAKQDDDDDNAYLKPPHVCVFFRVYRELSVLLLKFKG